MEKVLHVKGWYYNGKPRLIKPKNLDATTVFTPRRTGLNQTKPINIMVHGTFYGHGLKPGKWADPNAGTARAISEHYGGTTLAFQWGGRPSHKSRAKAATALAEEIKALTKKGYDVNIISHSHGGNVAIEALNKLPKDVKVGEFAALARPVRKEAKYSLPEDKVSYYITGSGTNDFTQVAGEGFRGGGAYDKRANVAVTIKGGGHGDVKYDFLQTLKAGKDVRLKNLGSSPIPKCLAKCKLYLGVGVGIGATGIGIGAGTLMGDEIGDRVGADGSEKP